MMKCYMMGPHRIGNLARLLLRPSHAMTHATLPRTGAPAILEASQPPRRWI